MAKLIQLEDPTPGLTAGQTVPLLEKALEAS